MLTVYRAKDYKDLSRKAANIISAQILLKPDSVLGLATGSSPVGTYEQLIDWYQKGDLDFSRISTINLDEYRGLSPENPQSYRYFMNTHLFNHVNVSMERTFVRDGLAEPEEGCKAYEKIHESLPGVDLQLLGLGHTGHIGFNEPDDHFEMHTHCVQLTDATIEANKRFFASREEVPTMAFTMGIGNIMKARKILMIVSGRDKAEILHQVLTGPVTPRIPASILQLHNDVIVIADEAALSIS